MAADPVVSPADTIRRARTSAKAMPWPASMNVEKLADLAAALLAVGERDKAEIERLRAPLLLSADAMIPLGKWLVDHQPSMPDEVAQPLLEWCERAEEFMALADPAVLADEEDAGNG